MLAVDLMRVVTGCTYIQAPLNMTLLIERGNNKKRKRERLTGNLATRSRTEYRNTRFNIRQMCPFGQLSP